ncbi:hypothetical protein BDZ45DRAFT_600402 [Acephala macrosclerotiorum]|nr:hypothetical protein BDZ45DRAFT_600402 [Acephala macrosclerotiorum]
MDPISFTIGVASVASIFQTCLHGYRSLNTAMAMGDAALTLNVQFRVEELRLKMWGRNWGLLGEEGEEAIDPPESSSESNVGLRDLTIEVLGRINKALAEWKKVGEKYSAGRKKDGKKSSENEDTADLLSNIASKQAQETKAILKQTKITNKIRWALKDKQDMEELLGRLTGLNDSLEKLLPRKERTSLARGLASELLDLLENGSMNGASEDMQIPFDHFARLAEPKLKDYQTQDGQGSTGNYIPLPRSMAIYAPVSKARNVPQSSIEAVPQVTLIEWRPSAHESRKSELTDKQLKERRDHIARLLHRTSITDGDFRILDCLGYTTTQAHVADGSTRDLVGYVYGYPEFASQKSLPISLRDLLGEAYASDSPTVPALEARFKLARELAIALYQLQCAGWVHRKVSSYNVIFFKDKETGEVNLNRPFLMGWQYSRPDDQRKMFPSEKSYASMSLSQNYISPFSSFLPSPELRSSRDARCRRFSENRPWLLLYLQKTCADSEMFCNRCRRLGYVRPSETASTR